MVATTHQPALDAPSPHVGSNENPIQLDGDGDDNNDIHVVIPTVNRRELVKPRVLFDHHSQEESRVESSPKSMRWPTLLRMEVKHDHLSEVMLDDTTNKEN